ncbi:hypothetical protein ZEAMMB73_Zm00001d027424 [Zea mays]|uniref:Myb/SANT-like domain-containing protein n=1 Tax=Zea mays TaxID=4577 RepID=A0A1R3LA27_MAIZE|nr:hypothetical protein ZEAMMB73_Zm00001d027424 [Zea mays]
MSTHAPRDIQARLWCSSPIARERVLSNGGGRNPQSLVDVDGDHGSATATQEIGAPKRAKWIHERKLFLIQLLKDHDVPGFRTQNAWCKEAWNNIVRRLNEKFGTSYTIGQVKQKEQDLKKDYRSVKELVEQSGFGWNGERMMVEAPDSVWASFAARKNNESALHWRDKSFPYYDDLSKLYDGRYAEGRTRQGMDHYANKTKKASAPGGQATTVAETYQSPSPTLNGVDELGLQFSFDEEIEGNLGLSQYPSA